MRRIDRSTEAAFEVATGRRRATFGERVSLWFEQVVNLAIVLEPEVFREVWTGYHGLTSMTAWLRRPGVWLRLACACVSRNRYVELRAWVRTRPDRATRASPDG